MAQITLVEAITPAGREIAAWLNRLGADDAPYGHYVYRAGRRLTNLDVRENWCRDPAGSGVRFVAAAGPAAAWPPGGAADPPA